jgi:hypothetical protein
MPRLPNRLFSVSNPFSRLVSPTANKNLPVFVRRNIGFHMTQGPSALTEPDRGNCGRAIRGSCSA